jgi:hypothetical protein
VAEFWNPTGADQPFRAEAADRARVVYMPDIAWPVHPHRLVLDEPGPRWFGLLTDKLIRRDVHPSVQAL